MCECGCTSNDLRYNNDLRYKFPGPGKSFYLLTLTAGCTACDAGSGVMIEHIKPGMPRQGRIKANGILERG
jgi:hypothetical protein